MSSLVITAATLDDEYNTNTNYNNNNSNNSNNSNNNSTCKKNQTYKNKSSQKIDKTMLQQLYNSNNSNNSKNSKNSNNDNYDMGDFVPVQKTMHTANIQQQVLNSNTKYNETLEDDEVVDKPNLEMSNENEIYKQFVNNYNNSIGKDFYNSSYSNNLNASTSNNDLIKRLDKILYLLEEDRNDQNHLITEELILYVFLGVFIIYVLDSFVKAGKYVR